MAMRASMGVLMRVESQPASSSAASAATSTAAANQRFTLRCSAVSNAEERGSTRWDRWTEAAELVAEMSRRNHATFVVLDLEKIEAGQAHGVRGIIEDVPAIPTADPCAKRVVVPERASQRRQPRRDPVRLAGQIGVDHCDERIDTALVFPRDSPRHLHSDAETKDEQRNKHHHPERNEEAGANLHGARCTVPS